MVLTVISVKSTVFWAVTPQCMVDRCYNSEAYAYAKRYRIWTLTNMQALYTVKMTMKLLRECQQAMFVQSQECCLLGCDAMWLL
jgi:hypothetical protein